MGRPPEMRGAARFTSGPLLVSTLRTRTGIEAIRGDDQVAIRVF